MQNNITTGIMNIPQLLNWNLKKHGEQDFTQLYKTLLDKTQRQEECPALLLLDDCAPTIIQDENGYEAVILDRNSTNHNRELKNIIRKSGEVIDTKPFDTIWFPLVDYRNMYNLVLDICKLLQIPAPAVFFSKGKPCITGIKKESNGYAITYKSLQVTDVFVGSSFRSEQTIKTLAHELRHVWQHKYHNSWFDDYDCDKTGDAYILQKPELDAEAFAYLFMEQYGVKYKLSNLGGKVYRALLIRMAEIRDERVFDGYRPILLE